MSIKYDLPKFTGEQGPAEAENFMSSVSAILSANEVAEARRVPIAQTAFKINSAAWTWLQQAAQLTPSVLADWDALKSAIRAEFCKRQTISTLLKAKALLRLKPEETPNGLYRRVQLYLLNKDFHLESSVKSSDSYKQLFDYQLRDIFIEGVPPNLLNRLTGLDITSASSEAVLDAVNHAADLSETASRTAAVHAIEQPSDEVDAIQRRPGTFSRQHNFNTNRSRQQSNQQRYQGQPQFSQQPRRGDTDQRRPGPSRETLRNRQLLECFQCHRMVKHRANECWQRTLASSQPSQARGTSYRQPYRNSQHSAQPQNQRTMAAIEDQGEQVDFLEDYPHLTPVPNMTKNQHQLWRARNPDKVAAIAAKYAAASPLN